LELGLRQVRRRFPFVERIVGDGGYWGPKMAELVERADAWTLEIVKRSNCTTSLFCQSAQSSNARSPFTELGFVARPD